MSKEEKDLTPEEKEQILIDDLAEDGITINEDGSRTFSCQETEIISGMVTEMTIEEPNGYIFEKLGYPFKILDSDSYDEKNGGVTEIEMASKKLNRYWESCSRAKMAKCDARKFSITDAKKAHKVIMGFFGK